MPGNQFTCPKCNVTLRTAMLVTPGMNIRCPKCQTIFAPPEEDAGAPATRPEAEVRPGPRDQAITGRDPATAPKRLVDDKVARDIDEPRRGQRQEKTSSTGLILALSGGGVLVVLLVAGVVAAWAFGLFGKGKATDGGPVVEPTYTLKLKDRVDVGKSVVVKSNHRVNVSVKVYDPDGLLINDAKQERVEEEVYTKTILEGNGDRPRKYKKTYEKALLGDGVRKNPRPYQGRTVHFELQGDKYQVRVEGQPSLNPRELQELYQSANKKEEGADLNRVMLPGKPVKVGESWSVDAVAFAKTIAEGGDFVAGQSSGEGKLVRVYEKEGKQHGILEWNLKVASRIVQGIRVETPSILEFKITGDGPIDGSSSAAILTMTMKATAKVSVDKAGQKYSQEMTFELSGGSDTSAERDASP